jgi:hypothetical protein
MKLKDIVLYRIFLPGLVIVIASIILPMMGLVSIGFALVIQVAGIIAILGLNLFMAALHDIPATYPDSNYTKWLNKLPLIGTHTR